MSAPVALLGPHYLAIWPVWFHMMVPCAGFLQNSAETVATSVSKSECFRGNCGREACYLSRYYKNRLAQAGIVGKNPSVYRGKKKPRKEVNWHIILVLFPDGGFYG